MGIAFSGKVVPEAHGLVFRPPEVGMNVVRGHKRAVLVSNRDREISALLVVLFRAGYRTAIVSELEDIRGVPELLLLDLGGVRVDGSAWLQRAIAWKMAGRLAGTATIVVDAENEADLVGGWDRGVDAYVRWAGSPDALTSLLQRMG